MQSKKDALTGAQDKISKAETAVAGAKKKQETAEQEKKASEKAVKDAQTKYDEAKKDAENADQQIAKGSLGFFEYMENNGYDADLAVKLLTGDQETVRDLTLYGDKMDAYNKFLSKTDIGAVGDATSLENMKLAFQYIRECNELRMKGDPENGFAAQEPLKVNSALMAISQMNVNYNKGKGHAGRFNFRIGENTASVLGDPFRYWYDDERKAYMERPGTDASGHYRNIIDPEIVYVQASQAAGGTYLTGYSLTGFALVSQGGTPYGFCQDFSYLLKDEGDISRLYGKSYSVDEYEALFNEYYDNLLNAKALVAECEKALQAAEEDLTAKAQALLDAQTALAKAQEELEALKAAAGQGESADTPSASLQDALKDAEAARDKMQAAYGLKQEAAEQAKISVQKASEKVSAAQAAFDAATAETEKASAAYEQAENAALAKADEVSRAYGAVEDARNSLLNLDAAVGEAAGALTLKEKAYQAALTAVEEAEKALADAKELYAGKEKTAKTAAAVLKEKQQKLEKAEADLTAAVEARDSAAEKYRQLQETAKEKEEALAVLAERNERARTELASAKKAYAAAVAEQLVTEQTAAGQSGNPDVMQASVPETGDYTSAAGWIGLAAVSGLTVGAAVWKKKNKKEQ